MRILIHGINFSPELTGIGKYSGEMAEWLAVQGHEVRVVTAPPYYPQWRVAERYENRWRKDQGQGARVKGQGEAGVLEPCALNLESVVVYRCPLWVPVKPSGMKRLLHLASFALSSFPIMLRQIFWRPDVVMVIEPSLMSAPAALLVTRLSSARAWLHVQDFEVDAAFDLGILQSRRLRSWVLNIEQWLMLRFDRVSTISPRMLEKLLDKGVASGKAMLFPNWVDTGVIFPLDAASPMHAELGIAQHKTIALYSGNMGEKQGLEILLEAASSLANRDDIQFVLCGEGAARVRLQGKYGHLSNVMWLSLQPVERLNDLLNMADFHLLPQRADAADLVMPSRLTGMLASGRPVVATAYPGTQVAEVVQHCGVVVTPGDADKLAQAVMHLADDETTRSVLGKKARAYAAANLERNVVLAKFEADLLGCVR
ncbi:glycosyltransferase WbuB [Ferrovum myxofaciens]|uniref:glycosyltransferase WbuB n=1 Tax=Ferrovum myxofaciens TaxID=416213 RepID=UPI003EC13AB8